MMYTVPPQDVPRLQANADLKVLETPELRTVFLGFDQSRPELLKSDVKGKNPFKDVRVRQAFNEAIDIKAIQQRVMRGQSHPTGLMYGPGVNGWTEASDVRYPYDPAAARSCWPRRATRTASASRWIARTTATSTTRRSARPSPPCSPGSACKVTLNAQTRLKYFAEISNPDYHTSFYMLGWTPTPTTR